MVDTETEYVKSLQYIMDVSTIFSILLFFCLFVSFLTTIFLLYVFFFTCRITWQRWTIPSYCHRSEARRIFSSGISKESTISTNGKSRVSNPVLHNCWLKVYRESFNLGRSRSSASLQLYYLQRTSACNFKNNAKTPQISMDLYNGIFVSQRGANQGYLLCRYLLA